MWPRETRKERKYSEENGEFDPQNPVPETGGFPLWQFPEFAFGNETLFNYIVAVYISYLCKQKVQTPGYGNE